MVLPGTIVLVPGKCNDSYDDDHDNDDDDDDHDNGDICVHCRWGLSNDLQALGLLVLSVWVWSREVNENWLA